MKHEISMLREAYRLYVSDDPKETVAAVLIMGVAAGLMLYQYRRLENPN